MSTPTTEQQEWTVETIWRDFSRSGILQIKKLADAHNASIGVERERADSLEQQAQTAYRYFEVEVQQLRTQLTAAQAAIVSHNTKDGHRCGNFIAYTDTAALDAAIADACKAQAEETKRCIEMIGGLGNSAALRSQR